MKDVYGHPSNPEQQVSPGKAASALAAQGANVESDRQALIAKRKKENPFETGMGNSALGARNTSVSGAGNTSVVRPANTWAR